MTATAFTTNDWSASFTKSCEDALASCSAMMNAMTRSTAVCWQGVEAMSRMTTDNAQATMNRSMEACQTFLAVKSPREAADQHANYMKDCFDHMLAGGSRLSEISLKTAKDSFEPLTKQVACSVETMMKKAKR